ncbi:MAG: hypothetical protein ACK5NT_04455 [Pyrinomonadaceae bacterium]
MPAIIFVPSRRRCDEAALEVSRDKTDGIDRKKSALREALFKDYSVANPEVLNHRHVRALIKAGVASHHAGHIPSWKFLIEKMMSSGLINALFATSTVAAGVDFPARTVVISNAETRGDDGWRPLEASELQQMTGRAGRRGKDNVGFAILAPGNFQNPPRIANLLDSPPDPLESKFRATYSNLLNLLDAYGNFLQVREIAEKSFAFRDTAKKIAKLERQQKFANADLEEYLEYSGGGVSKDSVFGFERLYAAKARLENDFPQRRDELRTAWLRENVKAGRMVSKGKGNKQLYFVLNCFQDKVAVMRGNGHGASIPLHRIQRVFENVYEINEESIENAFYETYEGKNFVLREPRISAIRDGNDDSLETLTSLISAIIDESKGNEKQTPDEILWEGVRFSDRISSIRRDIEYLRSEIWLPFLNRARVLDYFGYLDFQTQTVLEEGKWLADLRIDKPLLVGEILKIGVFEQLEPFRIAGMMAAVTGDAERDYGNITGSQKLSDVLATVEDTYFAISEVEDEFGVETGDEINYSAGATSEIWAEGISWEELVQRTKAEEGDLVRLLSRTGEALWQVAQLRESNPEAANAARVAADLILREPVR